MHLFGAVMVPFFMLWGKISFTEIMILQAIFAISMFLLEVPTGVVADRFGRKTSLIFAGVAAVIAPLVYVIHPNFWIFALGEFVWAFGAALTSGADSALIYDSLKEVKEEKRSKKIMARYGSFSLAGIMVAALIGGLVAQLWGPMMPMLLTSVPMVGALAIAFTFKEPRESKEKKESYWKTLKGGVKYLRGHRELRVLLFDYVIVGTLAFFMIWVYQVILQSYDVPLVWFGVIHAGIVVGEIIVLTNVERIEKLFGGKKKYLTNSAFMIGGLFLVLAFYRNLYVAVVCLFVIGAFGLTRKSIFSSYLNKFIESHNRATVLSVIAMVYSLSMATIDIILGRIVDWNLQIGLGIVGGAIILFTLVSKLEEEHLID
jgi:MFS family permease